MADILIAVTDGLKGMSEALPEPERKIFSRSDATLMRRILSHT